LKSVSAVFDYLAGGKEDPASKPGLASLLKTIWHAEYEDERDARFINERIHANIQKDGTFSVVPQMPGGITSPGATAPYRRCGRTVSRAAGQTDRGPAHRSARDTEGRPAQGLGRISACLRAMRTARAIARARAASVPTFAVLAWGDSIELALKIEKIPGFRQPPQAQISHGRLPRNCSEAMVKDLGAVAVEGGKWEIYIGGAAGSSVRKGDVLGAVDSHEEVLKYMGRFIQYYREHARYLERTHGFVARLGIDKIRAIVMEDSEGIGERLDREIAASKAAYKDPWQEMYSTKAAEFAPLLPVLS
jgi:nitrite reductase (NADH) large subunit